MGYTEIESIDEKIGERIKAARTRKYFVERELDECNELIPELEKVVDDYKNALKPWYKTSWEAARDFARDAAWLAARRAARDFARDAAWLAARRAALEDIAKDTAWLAAENAALDVAEDATWEVVRDIKGYENNPFEKLVKIYDMGLYPRGFRKVDGSERFIVDFPLVTHELGCWAEGDQQVLYKHEWYEHCGKIKPARPLRTIE
jgi:hypothetical protein